MKNLQDPEALGCAARPLSGGAWGKRGEKKKEGREGKKSSLFRGGIIFSPTTCSTSK